MDELGQILREAREARGLTLEQVAEETRINRRFLDALEQGDYVTLPTPVHVRGFLRNYARFLKLDPAPLLERYKQFAQQHPPRPPETAPAEETPLPAEPLVVQGDQPFFDPVNFEIESGQTRDSESMLRLVIIAALIVFLGLVASRFIPLLTGNGDGSQAIEAGVSDVWQQIVGQETPEPAAVAEDGEETGVSPDLAVTPADAAPTQVIQNTSRNNLSDAPAAGAAASPTVTPTRPPLPATMEEIQIRLDVTERTWMEVTIDGDVRFSGIARRGDTFEWTAEEEVRLLTGNAHGIVAIINEVELGRLGGFQEAKEEIWTTTQ